MHHEAIEVAQRAKAGVFRLAVGRDDTGPELRRGEGAVDDVGMALDLPCAVGEDEIERPLGAGDSMSLQGRDHHRQQRHAALTGFRLGPPDGVEAIRTLSNMQLASLV